MWPGLAILLVDIVVVLRRDGVRLRRSIPEYGSRLRAALGDIVVSGVDGNGFARHSLGKVSYNLDGNVSKYNGAIDFIVILYS